MRFILLGLGLLVTLIFIVLYFSGNKRYSVHTAQIRDDVFPLPDIFSVGFAALDIVKADTFADKCDVKTRRKYEELFGKDYVPFYLGAKRAAVVTYALMFLAIALVLAGMTGEIVLGVLIMIVPVLIPFYINLNVDSRIKDQHSEILFDYPNVLSKLALLINAGMTLRAAWDNVSESGNRKLYREMQVVSTKLANMVPATVAYSELADACRVNEIKKFVSIVCQNLEKGGPDLTNVMKELSVDAWTIKKNIARVKGNEASTKLIIPVGISFVAILVMILAPIMTGMQMGI